MKLVFDPAQKGHYPRHFLVNGVVEENPEVPERADRLFAAATGVGLEHAVPADHGLGPIAAVHTPEYIAFLSTIHERWLRIEGGSGEVVPGIHPDRRDGPIRPRLSHRRDITWRTAPARSRREAGPQSGEAPTRRRKRR